MSMTTPRRYLSRAFAALPALALLIVSWPAHSEVPAGDRPAGPILAKGEKEPKEWVIPNGRIVRPMGERATVGNFPLGIMLTPDQRQVIVTNCGAGKQSVTVLDADTLKQLEDQEVKTIFNGVAIGPKGGPVWVCGGGANNIQTFELSGGKLTPKGAVTLGGYPTSAVFSPDGKRLYVTCNLAREVAVVDPAKSEVVARIPTGTFPFGIAITPDGRKAYVSNWADATVSVLDLRANRPVRTLQTGGGLPCAITLSPDGKRLYVANANTDNVTVFDAVKDDVAATISLAPYPGAPYGAIPNGMAFAPDGKTLYVTMAGVNAVALISTPEHKVLGMLPTAWYPTGITVSKNGRYLYVVSSKGAGSGPNKNGGALSTMMRGMVERITVPDAAGRARATAQVTELNGFANRRSGGKPEGTKQKAVGSEPGGSSALPSHDSRLTTHDSTSALGTRNSELGTLSTHDLPSGIRHVVFIVRENRSYDQIMGDYSAANGDPTLTIFGADVTPNLHDLARRFAIGDNMYGDGEVSVQGHQWTLGANCPDYVEKTWAALYSHRGRLLDAIPNAASYPAIGYMMDHCVKQGVTCRMYGDIIRRERGGQPIASMAGKVAADYPGWNLSVPDMERARAWLAEFNKGTFPAFSYIWLPNDHTAGTQTGMPTPRAMVADNDLATGIIIEAISKHPDWKDTVIFLTEDDTQDGRDHVDAHRNVLLIASPWVKAGAVTSHHYSIASIYATIERMLNIPPMSQYDDLADPIMDVWQSTPDLRPYRSALNKVPLDEKNTASAPMARESAKLDLDEPDANTGPLLEEILWKAMKKN